MRRCTASAAAPPSQSAPRRSRSGSRSVRIAIRSTPGPRTSSTPPARSSGSSDGWSAPSAELARHTGLRPTGMRRNLTGWPSRLAPHLVFLIPELLMAAGPFVVQTVARAGRPGFRMPDFFYGGQALIEGVMMRGRTTVAMSVRPPSGEITTMTEPLPAALSADRRLIRIPLLRGIFVLYETLVIGTRMLMRSAAIAAEGEDVELGRGTIVMTMIVSLGFAIGLFFLLPLFLSTFAEDATSSDLAANIVEGVIRLAIFVAYIAAIGMMSDIRRVFAYHGAEHKAISAYEHDRPLTPEEVDAFGTAHTRCGTTFILIVVVISIFFFSLIPRAGVPLPLLFLSRIVLVPVIAAVAYELVRFGARHYGNRLVRALYTPGLWLQALTTRPPDRSMLEVSIASLETVLAADREATPAASA